MKRREEGKKGKEDGDKENRERERESMCVKLKVLQPFWDLFNIIKPLIFGFVLPLAK